MMSLLDLTMRKVSLPFFSKAREKLTTAQSEIDS